MSRLRFSGFPPRLKDDTSLRRVFGTLGTVVNLETTELGDVVSGTCRFSDPKEASLTLSALNGLTIGSHVISVIADDSPEDLARDSARAEAERSAEKAAAKASSAVKKARAKELASEIGADRERRKKEKTEAQQSAKDNITDEIIPVPKKAKLSDNEIDSETTTSVEQQLQTASSLNQVSGETKEKRLDSGIAKSAGKEKAAGASILDSSASRAKKGNEVKASRGSAKEAASASGKDAAKSKAAATGTAEAMIDVKTAKSLAKQEIRELMKSSKDDQPAKKTKSTSDQSSSSEAGLPKQGETGTNDSVAKKGAGTSKETSKVEKKAEASKVDKKTEVSKVEKKSETSKVDSKAASKAEIMVKDSETVKPRTEAKAADPSKVVAVKQQKDEIRPSPLTKRSSEPIPRKETNTESKPMETQSKQIAGALAGNTVQANPEAQVRASTDEVVWEVYWDEHYNCPYYYNPVTDETTWEPPPSGSKIVRNATEQEPNATDDRTFEAPVGATANSKVEIPNATIESKQPRLSPRNVQASPKPKAPAGDRISPRAGANDAPPGPANPVRSAQISTPPVQQAKTADPKQQQGFPETKDSTSGRFLTGDVTRGLSQSSVRSEDVRGHQTGTTNDLQRSGTDTSNVSRPSFKGRTTGEIITVKPTFGFIKCHAPELMSQHMYFALDRDAHALNLRPGDEVEFAVGFNLERKQSFAYALSRKRRDNSSGAVVQTDGSVRAPPGTSQPNSTQGDVAPPFLRRESSIQSVASAHSGGGAGGGPFPTLGGNRPPPSSVRPRSNSRPRNARPGPRSPRSLRLPGPGVSRGSPPSQPRQRGRSMPPTPSRMPPVDSQSRLPSSSSFSGPGQKKFWERYVDKPSGRPYWYSPATRESTWDDPYRR